MSVTDCEKASMCLDNENKNSGRPDDSNQSTRLVECSAANVLENSQVQLKSRSRSRSRSRTDSLSRFAKENEAAGADSVKNVSNNMLDNTRPIAQLNGRNMDGNTVIPNDSNKFHSQIKDTKRTEEEKKSQKGSYEGRIYEKLLLSLLAERGYKKYLDFAVGREVIIGKNSKLDDIVFRYTNENGDKDLIFLQIKHKQDSDQINSKILSAEASSAKRGGMRRDFNLQKYFISYLRDRKELKVTKSKELKGGNIKYVVIFTNCGFDISDLKKEDFSLKQAPNDVIDLFMLDNSSLTTQSDNSCNYIQIEKINEKLHKVLEHSADLYLIADELAKYTVWPSYRKKMDIGQEGPINLYHVKLVKNVINKFFSKEEKKWKGEFMKDFIENNLPPPEEKLRNAIFEAIKELKTSISINNDDEFKKVLRSAQWEVSKNFGSIKEASVDALEPWESIKEDDINDFLRDLVFIINQPKVEQLNSILNSSSQGTVLDNNYLKQVLVDVQNKIESIGPSFRARIESELTIHKKNNHKEKWISGSKIKNFVREQKREIYLPFIGTAMTLIYENKIMPYCEFQNLGELPGSIAKFLGNSNQKILCVSTESTLLSSIRVLQHLNTIKNKVVGRISIEFNSLQSPDNEKAVKDIFKLEKNTLLTLECEGTIQDKILHEWYGIIKNNSKKIILIAKQDNNLARKFATEYKDQYVTVPDIISFCDLSGTSQNEVLNKEIKFQGQKVKVNELFNGNTEEIKNLVDINTLVKLIKNEEIVIGSGNTGISDLTGAYAKLNLDIDTERFINSLVFDNENIFVITGIRGSEKSKSFIDKLRTLNTELPVDNIDLNQISDFHLDAKCYTRILLDDDKFEENDFQQLSHIYPDKNIYWISLKNGGDSLSPFSLHQIYNHNFYVDRQFNYLKKIIIKDTLHEELIIEGLRGRKILLLTGIDNQEDFFKLFPGFDTKSIRENISSDHPSVLLKKKNHGQDQFDELVSQYKYKAIHWLEIEQINGKTQVVCIKSRGILLNHFRKYIDDEKSVSQALDIDFIKDIKDKSVVIIADDPGMGKTTSLTKLCALQYNAGTEFKSIFQSHWVISITLKDHLSIISRIQRNIDTCDIINLCSEVFVNCDKTFLRNTLRFAFHHTSFIKPILIKFDGFDEILDEKIRDKVIALLQYLKDKFIDKNVKIWITTRLHYEQTLENALSTFATKFEPLNGKHSKGFIYRFFHKRLTLTLSKELFDHTFGDSVTKVYENSSSISRYAGAFLIKMKDIFKDDISKFIGTPLQLYLMLEGSIKYFKEWIEDGNDNNSDPNFDYLGDNMLTVYEKFIDAKYCIYLERIGIKGELLQKQMKEVLNKHHRDLAKSLILQLEPNKSLEEFQNLILSAGIIKYNGHIEFIHPTFREYFAAEVFVHWMKKWSPMSANLNKQKYLLTDIFMKPDYNVIRMFINLHLDKLEQSNTALPKKTLQQYGNLIDDLCKQKKNPLIINRGKTVLHKAFVDHNNQIVHFILDILVYSTTASEALLTEKMYGRIVKMPWQILSIESTVLRCVAAAIICCSEEKLQVCYNMIDKFLAVTNDKKELQKKMLIATAVTDLLISNEPVIALFNYINKKYSNNVHLISTISLIKKSEQFISQALSLYDTPGSIKILDLEHFFSKVQDKDVMSALLNIKFPKSFFLNTSILHEAVSDHGSTLEVLDWLIEYGADVNSINYAGKSVLQCARDEHVKKFLVEKHNAHVDVEDTYSG